MNKPADEHVIDECSPENEQSEPEPEMECEEEISPDPLEELQRRYDELHESYLRLAADLENVRKRSIRDLEIRTKNIVSSFARDLLEMSDNFERAMACESESSKEEILKLKKALVSILDRQKITSFASVGEQFDPSKHEAIALVPSDKEEGTIIDVACRGYCKDDEIIRHAKVIVSKGCEE